MALVQILLGAIALFLLGAVWLLFIAAHKLTQINNRLAKNWLERQKL